MYFKYLVILTLLTGCSKYTIKTTYINKTSEQSTRIVESEYTQKGSQTKVFAFFQKTFKFVNDELMFQRKN